MANAYCKWCGQKFPNVTQLSQGICSKNPNGKKHELYEGSEKTEYECKHCGRKFPNLAQMSQGSCSKSPGKRHEPRL
ncbi:hypothetical protein FACS1894130_11560 [Spirochaetia bacterium]|nr:hypothetical protein FACS1894130_11560 [Spirochaetia bacterium]